MTPLAAVAVDKPAEEQEGRKHRSNDQKAHKAEDDLVFRTSQDIGVCVPPAGGTLTGVTETRTSPELDLARIGRAAGEAVTTSARRAVQGAWQHRTELLILAATLGFVLIVGIVSAATLAG